MSIREVGLKELIRGDLMGTANSRPPYQSLFKYYATTDARRPLRLTRMGAISKHEKVVMT